MRMIATSATGGVHLLTHHRSRRYQMLKHRLTSIQCPLTPNRLSIPVQSKENLPSANGASGQSKGSSISFFRFRRIRANDKRSRKKDKDKLLSMCRKPKGSSFIHCRWKSLFRCKVASRNEWKVLRENWCFHEIHLWLRLAFVEQKWLFII